MIQRVKAAVGVVDDQVVTGHDFLFFVSVLVFLSSSPVLHLLWLQYSQFNIGVLTAQ